MPQRLLRILGGMSHKFDETEDDLSLFGWIEYRTKYVHEDLGGEEAHGKHLVHHGSTTRYLCRGEEYPVLVLTC